MNSARGIQRAMEEGTRRKKGDGNGTTKMDDDGITDLQLEVQLEYFGSNPSARARKGAPRAPFACPRRACTALRAARQAAFDISGRLGCATWR